MKIVIFILIAISAFNLVNQQKVYKAFTNHNPLQTQKYSADPGAMVYNDRVYVYATNDHHADDIGGNPQTNTYGHITSLNVFSSADLVNWVDHGSIPVAGGAAKWAHNSWAPCAVHKSVGGKEKFFVYFADSANGIGVLSSDSPTGPFVDPIGKALINRNTPNCGQITWLFDPGAWVDKDGKAYLVFGGGVPDGKAANPGNARVVQLGDDMTSIVGTPKLIDAPWLFEDNGLTKAGNTWVYTYCTNWSGGPYGNARIAYMTANDPLGPYTFVGTLFNNQGDFLGSVGNNHHTILEFKNKWYIFYHSEWLNKQVFGSEKGYRTTHVDYLPYDGGKFGNAKATLAGVEQLADVNAFESHPAALICWESGVSVNGLGHTTVAYNNGDYTGVSKVALGNGAKSVKISAASKGGADVKVTIDKPDGTAIATIKVSATGDNQFKEFSADVSGASGTKNIFFVASGDVTIDTWEFA